MIRVSKDSTSSTYNMLDCTFLVTFNGRMRQVVYLDATGITTWNKDAVGQTVHRGLRYPKYEYRLLTRIVYARKYNIYFGLGKDFSLKVYLLIYYALFISNYKWGLPFVLRYVILLIFSGSES